MPDLTVAEYARRYGVARSTVVRALQAAERNPPQDPAAPRAPRPANPGEPQLRYPCAEMDAWWPTRPRPGRPTGTGRRPAGEQQAS